VLLKGAIPMTRNITLSADAALIDAARAQADRTNTTLNAAFRDWLAVFTGHKQTTDDFDTLMQRFDYAGSGGRHFSREDMNAR